MLRNTASRPQPELLAGEKPAARLRGLSAELIANRSDRRLPNLLGCKACEADGLMSGRCADFYHGPELFVVPLRGRIHAFNRISDHRLTILRTGLGPGVPPDARQVGSRVG